MPTIAAAKAWAVQELTQAQKKSSQLTADLLIAYVLGWDRVRVLSHPEAEISQNAFEIFQRMVLRRADGEPLQYLTGEQEFYGLAFHVGPGVLIPRPETEILVEKAICLIRSRPGSECRILDIGTGSGCIATAVAHEIRECTGCAVDISAAALRIARENLVRHGVADRIRLIRTNLADCFPRIPRFDFIFCNPPYVALRDCDSLPAEVKNHEPHGALFGGEAGTEIYRALMPEIPSRLMPGGYLLLELGAGQESEVSALAKNAGLSVETVLPDLQSIPRCLVARKIPGVLNG
jgi:release factor glutamine methyltransferase